MMLLLHKKIQKFLGRGKAGRRDREGFTLVEIMMVLLILSLGILPIAVIQHQARREVSESDNFTRAITVAQGQIEWIKGLGFGNATADTGVIGNIAWTSTITTVSTGLERIEVTAHWQSQDQMEQLTIADLVSIR